MNDPEIVTAKTHDDWLSAQTEDLRRVWFDFLTANPDDPSSLSMFRLAVIAVMSLTQLAYNVTVLTITLRDKK